MAKDWYRSKLWDPEIAAEFERRLGRARHPRNKAESLRIQAITLLETREPNLVETGRALMERFAREYPENWDVAGGYESVGNAFADLGILDVAELYYRRCLAAMRSNRTHTSGTCHLSLAELLLRRRHDDLAEIEDLIQEFAKWDGAFFLKSSRFRYLTACARVAARREDGSLAGELARQALAIFADGTPQLPRLPGFGAPVADAETLQELGRLAGRPMPVQ